MGHPRIPGLRLVANLTITPRRRTSNLHAVCGPRNSRGTRREPGKPHARRAGDGNIRPGFRPFQSDIFCLFMKIVHTIPELREALSLYKRPAFVPTMGNLHDGHIALVKQAKPLGDVSVSSIFVNRLQFAPHEDFDSYPRTLDADAERLKAAGCNVLFAPLEKHLYPEPQTYKVH